jgi:hypothetical protein
VGGFVTLQMESQASQCAGSAHADVDITFVNWAHFLPSMAGWTRTAGLNISHSTELVFDDVILNGPTTRQNGTGTPGSWKNHPEAWPVDSLTIGGMEYSQAEIIALLEANDSLDVTFILFRSLAAAERDALVGNDYNCLADTLAAADDWLVEYDAAAA